MKLFSFLIILLLIIVACNTASEKVEQFVYSNTDSLRVRSAPSLKSETITKLGKKEKVTLLSISDDSLAAIIDGNTLKGVWLEVETQKNIQGWVFSGGMTGISDSAFNEKNYSEEKFENYTPMYINFKKSACLYKVPRLGSEIIKKIKGPFIVNASKKCIVIDSILNNNQKWVRFSYYDSELRNAYTLEDNLVSEKQFRDSLVHDFQKLIVYFDNVGDNEYLYKSIKEYANGDDGAEWTEEAQLEFYFSGNELNISMGYMYTGYGGKVINVSKQSGDYILIVANMHGSTDIIRMRLKKNLDIIVKGFGELSGKYVPGKASNYLD